MIDFRLIFYEIFKIFVVINQKTMRCVELKIGTPNTPVLSKSEGFLTILR